MKSGGSKKVSPQKYGHKEGQAVLEIVDRDSYWIGSYSIDNNIITKNDDGGFGFGPLFLKMPVMEGVRTFSFTLRITKLAQGNWMCLYVASQYQVKEGGIGNEY